jgi:hypothetical protein
MKVRIKNINPVQLGLVLAVLYAILGLIFALFFAPFMAVMGSLAPMGTLGRPSGGMGVGSALAVIVIFPIVYAVAGFIGGVIVAFVYNLVAGWTGGIELTANGAEKLAQPSGYSGSLVS